MGCDIHLYLEHAYIIDTNDEPYWTCFVSNGGSRDYHMFGILAGVRCDGALFEPRGMPEGRLSWDVEGDNYLRINDESANKGYEGYCTRAQAESWGGITADGTKVAHPDWHSHSWLTHDEFAQCLAEYTLTSEHGPYAVEYDAVLAAMRCFEERGHKTRLVFWFDN